MANNRFPLSEYNETKRLNPYWSDYVCFYEVVKNKIQLHPKTLRRYFEKLVDKDDYARSDKKAITDFLIKASKGIGE